MTILIRMYRKKWYKKKRESKIIKLKFDYLHSLYCSMRKRFNFFQKWIIFKDLKSVAIDLQNLNPFIYIYYLYPIFKILIFPD